MAKIYVGCSLTQAPPEFVGEVESFKDLLRAAGHQVANFVGTVNGTAAYVYETDIHRCVFGCELMVAICDHPSIGLGWEMATAVEKLRRPVLAVAHHDAKVSRLPIGAECERNPLYRFCRYSILAEVVPLVEELLLEADGGSYERHYRSSVSNRRP